MSPYKIKYVEEITPFNMYRRLDSPEWEIIAKQRSQVRSDLREIYAITRQIILGDIELTEYVKEKIKLTILKYGSDYHRLCRMLAPQNEVQQQDTKSHPLYYLLQVISESFFEKHRKFGETPIHKGILIIYNEYRRYSQPMYQINTPSYYPLYLCGRLKDPKSLITKAMTGAKTTNDIIGMYGVIHLPKELKEEYDNILRNKAQKIENALIKKGFTPLIRKSLIDTKNREYYPLMYKGEKTKFIIIYLGNYNRYEVIKGTEFEKNRKIKVFKKREGLYLLTYNIEGKEKYMVMELIEGNVDDTIQLVKNAICIYEKEYEEFKKIKYAKEVYSKDIALIPTGIFYGFGLEKIHLPTNIATKLIESLPYNIKIKKKEGLGIRDYLRENRKSNGYEAIHLNLALPWKGEYIEVRGMKFNPLLPILEIQLTEMDNHVKNKIGEANHQDYKKNTAEEIEVFYKSLVPCHAKDKREKLNKLKQIKTILKEIDDAMSQWHFPKLSYP